MTYVKWQWRKLGDAATKEQLPNKSRKLYSDLQSHQIVYPTMNNNFLIQIYPRIYGVIIILSYIYDFILCSGSYVMHYNNS